MDKETDDFYSSNYSYADDRQVNGSHYQMDVSPWSAMESWLSHEEFVGFLKGNSIKYLSRDKDDSLADIKKAHHYLEKLIEVLEAKKKEGASDHIADAMAYLSPCPTGWVNWGPYPHQEHVDALNQRIKDGERCKMVYNRKIFDDTDDKDTRCWEHYDRFFHKEAIKELDQFNRIYDRITGGTNETTNKDEDVDGNVAPKRNPLWGRRYD